VAKEIERFVREKGLAEVRAHDSDKAAAKRSADLQFQESLRLRDQALAALLARLTPLELELLADRCGACESGGATPMIRQKAREAVGRGHLPMGAGKQILLRVLREPDMRSRLTSLLGVLPDI
jgi:hypothetical protein